MARPTKTIKGETVLAHEGGSRFYHRHLSAKARARKRKRRKASRASRRKKK